MAASGVLLDPLNELILRHQQPLADPQRRERAGVEQLVSPCAGDAQCRRQLIGVQHRRQIVVVVVHTKPP